MKSKSEFLTESRVRNSTREWYEYNTDEGYVRFRLLKDSNNCYYDYTDYQFKSVDRQIVPCTFTISNPKDFYNLFFENPLSCEIHSYRFYGEPKLKKPKELNKVKQSFSVECNPKCKCPVFVKDNDLWIKHRDFFSPSFRPPDTKDVGTPLSYRLKKYFNKNLSEKFMYPDSWGDIVLRNEAWIVFRNFKQAVIRYRHPIISLEKAFCNTDLLIRRSNIRQQDLYGEWYNFFEDVVNQYKEFINIEKEN